MGFVVAKTRGRALATSRLRRLVTRAAAASAIAALVSMPASLPASARPKWSPPVPQDVAGIPVVDARPKPGRPVWTAGAHAVRGPQPVNWPEAAGATVDLAAVPSAAPGTRGPASANPRVAAGTLPIKVGRAATAGREAQGDRLGAGAAGPTKVTVRVHDRNETARAGVRGLLLDIVRADGRNGAGTVELEVDYSAFAAAYGGDWASRLRLVELPACALTTPERAECQTPTPLPGRNNAGTLSLVAEVPVADAQATILAAQAEPNGDNGDFTATSLSPAGTWQISTQTGAFTWSYPLRTPPALGGPQPSVSFGYGSSSVDGRTATSNNQGGWVGDGWNSWPGFIERGYASCNDDNPSHKTGDLCWFTDNATLSLDGHAGELIKSGSVWRLKDDDGTRVERITDANRGNGDNDNEYWRVTTTDGTQYYFGYHRLPGWSAGKQVTDSTWTVPVYGNNSGEPCYDATFANAYCNQAWRWNLDYVVDPHGNSMAYFYGKETGAYGRDLNSSQRTTYDRGGYVDRIEYGMRSGSEYSQAAPLRVLFNTAERCLSGCWSGTAWTSDPNTPAWPDTPWDQYCAATPCTQWTPTFWSARRLTKVTAQVRNGTSSYADVESWALRQEFVNAGTGEGTPMWLRGITRTGHVTSAGGSAVSDPEITFDPGAEPLPNRVDGPNDGRTALNRWRIKTITTESGGQINVTYSPVSDCSRSNPPNPETNTTRCMPAYYAPSGTPTLDWFHKYVVLRVDLDDTVTDQPNQSTFYDYLDAPAWHYNDDEITKDKFRTWGEWRGYGRVLVRQGDPTNGVQTAVEYRYLRGMDGDHLSSGVRDVWVSDSWGGSIEDHESLQGFVREQITFNGPGGAEVSSTVTEPWKTGPTATRTRNGITTNAWKVRPGTTRARTALAAGGFRTTKTVANYNSDGLEVTSDDYGDEAVTGDETCTRTTYARNDSAWILDTVSQKETLSVGCANATTPATPSTVLYRTRTFYDSYVDESSFGAPPTKGDEVRVEELDSWNGPTPVYVPIARNTYDANGRGTASTDARGNTSTTAYTTANGGLVTQTVETNAINQATTTLREPAWDLPAKITDANGVVTDLTYDGLGRLTNVWLPGRAKAAQTPSLKFSYLVRNSGGPTAVITENLLPTGAAYKKRIDLYDGFLRPRQTQTQATGGGRLLTDTFYTTAGQKDWTSAAYYDSTNAPPSTALGSPQGQIPSITVYAYDGAGRTTDTIFKALGVEKWRTTNSYGGDRVTTLPPAGDTATTTITDARGQTTKLLQYKSFADVGSSDPSRFDATSYTYTLLGQLGTVTDQAGSVWSYGYDLRGRQIQAVDPDRGTTTSGYDVVGNRTTVTSPLGTGTTTVAYIYDALNRRTTMRDDSAAGPLRAEWVYDTLPMGKGQITSATRYSGGNPYTIRVNSYDAYSRPTSTSVVLPPTEAQLCAAPAPDVCTYTTTLSYKPNGQPFQVTLPAAADLASEKLTIGYNDIGDEGTLLSASQIYVYSVIYDKLGQLTQRQLGAFGSRIAVTSSFDEPTGRPTGMNVVPELKPEAARYAYSYDNAGNVTKIVEAPAGQSADNQCFSYDYLSRLTEAWTPASGDCAAARSLAALGGPAPYWQSWTIDSNGNRLTETRHAATNTVLTYSYPSAGSARPHAVTRVTASGAVSWIHNYAYDNGGNTTNRPNAAGAAQALTWDREGHLDTVVDGATTTRYIYGPDGNRLIRSDGTGKTLYLPGGTEVRYDNASAAKKAARYYTHSGQTIAVRTASGLSWITTDHHGTAELAIDAATLTVAKRRALPFGEARGSVSGTWPGAMDKGFVGGTQDPTGLVHLGAREYDPLLGRFISDDPVTDTDDPQQLQGYLYANNSPETESDPNGMCWSGFGAVCNAWNGLTGAVSSGASTVWHGATGGWPPIRHWISDKFAHFRHSVSDKFAHFRHSVSDKFARSRHSVSDKFARSRHWVSDKFARARHYVAVHGPNALKRAFHVARFIVNLPATVPGLLYAGASGADCGWASGLMITCTGARRFAPKGGQTVGNVFTTRNLSVSPTVLEHETQHANQYAALGTMFPGLGLPAFGVGYAGASGFSWVTYHIFGERHDGAGNVCNDAWACYNIFEIDADLHKGKYYQRP